MVMVTKIRLVCHLEIEEHSEEVGKVKVKSYIRAI